MTPVLLFGGTWVVRKQVGIALVKAEAVGSEVAALSAAN